MPTSLVPIPCHSVPLGSAAQRPLVAWTGNSETKRNETVSFQPLTYTQAQTHALAFAQCTSTYSNFRWLPRYRFWGCCWYEYAQELIFQELSPKKCVKFRNTIRSLVVYRDWDVCDVVWRIHNQPKTQWWYTPKHLYIYYYYPNNIWVNLCEHQKWNNPRLNNKENPNLWSIHSWEAKINRIYVGVRNPKARLSLANLLFTRLTMV